MPMHIMKRVPKTNAQALAYITSAFTNYDTSLTPINKDTLEDNLSRVTLIAHNMVFDIIRQLKGLVPDNKNIHGKWPSYDDYEEDIMNIEGVVKGSSTYYLLDDPIKYKIVTGYLETYIKYCDLRKYENESVDEEIKKRWDQHYYNIEKEHPELKNPIFLSREYIKLQTMTNKRMSSETIQS